MKKPFWIPFIAAFGTMILLYLIGFIADIGFLRFIISDSYMEVSFTPILVGILIGFLSERMKMDEGMKQFLFIAFIAFLSYLGGIAAYNLALFVIWDEIIGSGDLVAVLFWGGMVFGLLAVPIYLGIIHLIDKKYKGNKMWLYPIGCMLIFFVPTLFIMMMFGGINLTSLFGPEAMLFHVFFLTSGFIFGLCSWRFKKFVSIAK